MTRAWSACDARGKSNSVEVKCLDCLYIFVFSEAPSIIRPVVSRESHNEGINPVNIICEATGKPDPDVRWIHNGKVKSSGTKTAQLAFSPITKKDVGVYICTANNTVGSAEKNLNLVVNCKYFVFMELLHDAQAAQAQAVSDDHLA